MAERSKLLIQKRTSLKSQIINLSNLLDKNKISGAALKLRGARLTELYQAYEEYNDELMLLEPNETHGDEFAIIQERFYALAGKIEDVSNISDNTSTSASTSSGETRSNSNGTVTSVKTRRIKLLEASLPTFDGRFEG